MTVQETKPQVEIKMQVSAEFYETLELLAEQTATNQAQVFAMALTLLKMAAEAEAQGKKLAILDKDQTVDIEIVGILPSVENR